MMGALRKSSEPARPVRAPISSSETLTGNALFEALICEIHWTALQVGAISICMNASLASRRSWMLRACSNLVPVESPVVKAWLRSWQQFDLPDELASAVRHIYFDLTDAKALALPLIKSAGNLTAPTIPHAKLEQIAAIWRKLAEDCRATAFELEPQTRWRLGGAYTENALVLGKFLKEAVSGSRTYVNHFGEVAMPILPQRRRTPRVALRQPCKISWEGGSTIAVARDISKIDLRIDCERGFRLKEPILVTLRNGRGMRAVVVWCRDGSTDVRFETPLETSDALLSA
jgi:hypothetical protein